MLPGFSSAASASAARSMRTKSVRTRVIEMAPGGGLRRDRPPALYDAPRGRHGGCRISFILELGESHERSERQTADRRRVEVPDDVGADHEGQPAARIRR